MELTDFFSKEDLEAFKPYLAVGMEYYLVDLCTAMRQYLPNCKFRIYWYRDPECHHLNHRLVEAIVKHDEKNDLFDRYIDFICEWEDKYEATGWRIETTLHYDYE